LYNFDSVRYLGERGHYRLTYSLFCLIIIMPKGDFKLSPSSRSENSAPWVQEKNYIILDNRYEFMGPIFALIKRQNTIPIRWPRLSVHFPIINPLSIHLVILISAISYQLLSPFCPTDVSVLILWRICKVYVTVKIIWSDISSRKWKIAVGACVFL